MNDLTKPKKGLKKNPKADEIKKQNKDPYDKKYFPPRITKKHLEDINKMANLGLNYKNKDKKEMNYDKIFIKK